MNFNDAARAAGSSTSRHRSWMQSMMVSMESGDHGSQKNEMEIQSTTTTVFYQQHQSLKGVTKKDTKKMVSKIVRDIFEQKRGTTTLSDSECSLDEDMRESLDMDPA